MRSLQRMLAVFESFTSDKTILTLQEICDRIDLPKSTTFRIVRSLEEAGYLVRLDNHRYCLSFRFTRLAGFVHSTLDIRTISRPVLQTLAEQTMESVSIHAVVDHDRVCLDTVTFSGAPLRSVAQPGEHLPLGTGSVSKVLVAYLPPEELEAAFAGVVESSGRTRDDWAREIAQVHKRRYAVSHGERQLGLSGVSAPIFDVNGRVPYCLTVSGPTARLQAQEQVLIGLVRDGAASISRQMGGDARQE